MNITGVGPNMLRLVKFGIFWFICTIIILALFSCGPTYYLKRSEINMRKAIIHGAKVKDDTVYTKKSFVLKGPNTTLNLSPYILRKDGTSVVYKDTIIYKDKIKIQFKDKEIAIDCPDSTVVERVPTYIDRTVSSGYTKWNVVLYCFAAGIFAFIVGIILGKINIFKL